MMTAKKYKHLYKTSGSKQKAASASNAKDSEAQQRENNADKQTIEQLKKLIDQKFKDPEVAKKAAQVISDMLDKK